MYYEHSSNPLMNTTMTTPPMDLSMYEEAARDERPLLIVMMLAVSNSVLDPLIYGEKPYNQITLSIINVFIFFF